MPKPQEQKPGGPPNKNKKNDDKNDDKGGRPKFKQDKEPRKKRTETPKSKPGLAETIMWAQGSFDAISENEAPLFICDFIFIQCCCSRKKNYFYFRGI